MWLLLCLLLVAAFACYTLLPELLYHIWHIGSFHHGNRDARTVALTFDDGPDPRYTPRILDILREHQVQATFFVVGEAARAHPDLIQKLMDDGHELASHGYNHKHAWMRLPRQTWRDLLQVRALFESNSADLGYSPVKIHYYRPPWGAFNLVIRGACKRLGWTPVLWDVRAKDWISSESPESISNRVVSEVEPGSIVLCHDAGGEVGAPLNTIQALPDILVRLKNLGFGFATVGQLHQAYQVKRQSQRPIADYPILRRWMIQVWKLVEYAFDGIYHVLTLNTFLRVSPAIWKHGLRTDPADGGILIQNGAGALDIHFQSETLVSVSTGDNRALIKGLRTVKSEFRDLARILKYHPDYQHVQVAMAYTLMNRGIELLGFHVESLPDTLSHRWLERYMKFLMGLYHREGFQRLRQGSQDLTMKLVWMTREEIIRLYGEGV